MEEEFWWHYFTIRRGKEKVWRTTFSVPQDLYRNILRREIQTHPAETCTAHSRLLSSSYWCSTNPSLPKRFPSPPNLAGLKGIQENALNPSNLKKRKRRNRDLLDSKEALMHYIVQNMIHFYCPNHTKGSGVTGNATQKRQLEEAKWQHKA